MDRNQLEQEALRQLNLGSHEGALKAYSQILKLDPRDRRIRQKVGELYLKLGRVVDAEKQLREVAEGLVKENSHRAAVSVLKQLVGLRPDDPGLQAELGECYLASGYANDARANFDAAMRQWITQGRALDAAKVARKLVDLSPGEPALRLKVAELLEAGGDPNGAATVYQEVADSYRRRGRPDEVGRIAELALKLRPDDLGLLLDAAAARVEAGEHKKALVHLQLAFSQAPREPKTLDLLSRALEGVNQPEKALKVLSELGRVAADREDVQLEAEALRRAARLNPNDPDVTTRLAAAEERVNRMERRLTQLDFAQPTTEPELIAQVKAEVYLRYGFMDRADAVLRQALERAPDSIPLLAAIAEAEVARGRVQDGLRWMERVLPQAGADQPGVLDRIAVLGGNKPASAAPVNAPPALANTPAETAELRGDRLAGAGDLAGAMMAWREALSEDPLNDGVLAKIAALRERTRAPAPPPPPEPAEEPDPFADFAPLEDGTFEEIDPLDVAPMSGDLEEARSLAAVGLWADVLPLVERETTLEAAVLRSQATRGLGDTSRALDILREALNDAAESDPAYCDALFEASALYTATGKHRAAMRLLEELRELDVDFKTGEVDARMRGLQRLLK